MKSLLEFLGAAKATCLIPVGFIQFVLLAVTCNKEAGAWLTRPRVALFACVSESQRHFHWAGKDLILWLNIC